jgi:peptidoglycan/LPS O-acetylase OafA/YrhL
LESQSPNHFAPLDSLRGIAAVLVVIYHLPAWYPPLYQLPIVRNGGLMVNFFFVLSGFVIYHAYSRRLKTRFDVVRFMFLRLGRIYPVHLVFLILFLVAEGLKYWAANRGVAAAVGPAFRENGLSAFIESLFLVHALGFSSHANAFNFPSWSISTEFYTYLLFALCAALFSRRHLVVVSMALSAICLAILLTRGSEVGEFRWWLRCVAGFFLGCCAAAAYPALAKHQVPRAAPIVSLAALLAFLNWPGASAELVYPLSAAVVLALALSPASSANRVLSLRPLLWLGAISYSLYMSHALVLWVARQICRIVLKAPDAIVDGAATAQLSSPQAWLVTSATVAGSLLLAWLTYRTLENPWRKRSRDFAQQLESAVPAGHVRRASS